jgi:hypothetical protein
LGPAGLDVHDQLVARPQQGSNRKFEWLTTFRSSRQRLPVEKNRRATFHASKSKPHDFMRIDARRIAKAPPKSHAAREFAESDFCVTCRHHHPPGWQVGRLTFPGATQSDAMGIHAN